jgi:hypothetical protein
LTLRDPSGTGGNPAGFLNPFLPQSEPSFPDTGQVVNDGAGYTGGYAGYQDLTLRFDWLGYAGPEWTQSLFFESLSSGGSVWAYDLVVPDQTWTSFEVPFSATAGWQYVSGLNSSFDLALAQVDLIGFTIYNPNSDAEYNYGLDNWQFSAVPEPGTVALCLGLTFRRDLIQGVKRLAMRS